MSRVKKIFIKSLFSILLIGCSFLTQSYAQETPKTVFSGMPVVKISEGGVDRVVEKMKECEASEFKCTITKIGDKYFWTTRNNVELIPMQSGAFLTFVAASGAGYVRIVVPALKDAAALTDETARQYDYVEHMLTGLKSVTYFGKRDISVSQ